MVSRSELAFTPAWKLRDMIKSKQVSPVEVTQAFLERIQAQNPKLNAYITVTADEAMAEARAAEQAVARGGATGALLGVPISVKDLIPTKGVRTTYGSAALKDNVPTADAIVVERIKAAGAVILGKTNTSEFGHSLTVENKLGEPAKNPWDVTRTTGGSTGGGAAAVAAGLGPLAIGGDGGGSIRVPSSFNGVVGLKPTRGRVPAVDAFEGFPLFSELGPLARTVRDVAMLLHVLAGHDKRDPVALRQPAGDYEASLGQGIRGLRVAFSPTLGGFAAAEPVVKTALTDAAKVFGGTLGAHVEEAAPQMEDATAIFGTIFVTDARAAQGHLLEKQAEDLMPYVKSTLEYGATVTATDYSKALRGLERHRAKMADFFERFNLLLIPTTAVPAFAMGQRPRQVDGQKVSGLWGGFPFTMPFNLSGNPAASVPCGFTPEGLPMGLQIIGRHGEEATVLRAAASFEQAKPWADKHPNVA